VASVFIKGSTLVVPAHGLSRSASNPWVNWSSSWSHKSWSPLLGLASDPAFGVAAPPSVAQSTFCTLCNYKTIKTGAHCYSRTNFINAIRSELSKSAVRLRHLMGETLGEAERGEILGVKGYFDPPIFRSGPPEIWMNLEYMGFTRGVLERPGGDELATILHRVQFCSTLSHELAHARDWERDPLWTALLRSEAEVSAVMAQGAWLSSLLREASADAD
jgi:hypothetical protein